MNEERETYDAYGESTHVEGLTQDELQAPLVAPMFKLSKPSTLPIAIN